MQQPVQRLWWRMNPKYRHRVHPARSDEVFAVKDTGSGSENLRLVAKSLTQARPFEVACLFMLRDDETQARAMEMYQLARNTFWTRLAVVMAALSLPTAIVAALIEKG